MMDTIKVIIENWPKTNHLLEYLPILIAVVAVIISLYSAHLTRKSFIASHRPYVWASNYGVIDQDKKTIIPIPHRVGYRIKNSPAKIILTEVEISLNNETLFNYKDENIVRFPDESSEWSFSIGEKDFKNIMNRSNEDKSKLTRHISLKYSSLGGGKIYHYELQQTFEPIENQWKDKSEKAS
jgi:hypothetical protein